jgi:hypothetical protein
LVFLRLLPRLLGVLLLVAAALKAHGAAVGPVSSMGWTSAAWFQAVLIIAEVGLGGWLLSGIAPLGSWMLALIAFVTFAGFSAYQGSIGQSSCGCLGRLSDSVSPWYTFGFDLLVLTGLAFGRPDLAPLWQAQRATLARPLLGTAGWFAGGAFVFAGLVAAASWQFGSLDAAVAHMRGQPVAVVPQLVDVGDGNIGRQSRG